MYPPEHVLDAEQKRDAHQHVSMIVILTALAKDVGQFAASSRQQHVKQTVVSTVWQHLVLLYVLMHAHLNVQHVSIHVELNAALVLHCALLDVSQHVTLLAVNVARTHVRHHV